MVAVHPSSDDPHGHLRDPRASLRICGATMALPEPVGSVNIPAVDAAAWLDVLMMGSLGLSVVLNILDTEDARRIRSALVRGKLGFEDLENALGDVLTVVSGRPHWETIMIVAIAASSWDQVTGGELTLRGIRAEGMPLGAWVDAVWLLMRQSVDSRESLATLVSQVRSKPAARRVDGEDSMDEAEFEQAMAAWS